MRSIIAALALVAGASDLKHAAAEYKGFRSTVGHTVAPRVGTAMSSSLTDLLAAALAARAPLIAQLAAEHTDAWRLLREGVEVAASSGDIALLRIFVEHPNRVLSRDAIVERLKGYERDAFDRSIDVRVTRLRRKIEVDPAHPAFIRTVRGEGYLFHPPGAAA